MVSQALLPDTQNTNMGYDQYTAEQSLAAQYDTFKETIEQFKQQQEIREEDAESKSSESSFITGKFGG